MALWTPPRWLWVMSRGDGLSGNHVRDVVPSSATRLFGGLRVGEGMLSLWTTVYWLGRRAMKGVIIAIKRNSAT